MTHYPISYSGCIRNGVKLRTYNGIRKTLVKRED